MGDRTQDSVAQASRRTKESKSWSGAFKFGHVSAAAVVVAFEFVFEYDFKFRFMPAGIGERGESQSMRKVRGESRTGERETNPTLSRLSGERMRERPGL